MHVNHPIKHMHHAVTTRANHWLTTFAAPTNESFFLKKGTNYIFPPLLLLLIMLKIAH
jgi:hypothetical protein